MSGTSMLGCVTLMLFVWVAPVVAQENDVERGLTPELARKLLPAASGIHNADFETLSIYPRRDVVKSQSLSLALLTLRPPVNRDGATYEEFRFLGDQINLSDIVQAMWISKDQGYASFIQPKYITDCTCESTAERAEGVVTFKHDLFTGRIPFIAQATKDGWVITEFRLPQNKTKVVRDKDGVWSQEALEGGRMDAQKAGEPILKRFVLKEADVTDLAKVLSPFFKDARIVADPHTKSLLVQGASKTLDRLTTVIALLDQPAAPGSKDKDREYRKGQKKAGKDVASGTPKYKRYGQPSGTDKLLGQILKADYGITLDIVAGCKVPEDVRQRADGYNEVVLAHMTKRGQKDFLAAAEKKTREQWDQLTPEERTRLFGFVPHLDRIVSLTADNMPLRDALMKVVGDADLGIELDDEALSKAGLALDKRVSVKFENVPLARAIGYLIDWNAHPTVLREVRRGRLVFTTLDVWQASIAASLPEWMTPFYNKGLLATLDDDDEVATVTVGSIVNDELMSNLKSLPKLRELSIDSTKKLTPAGLTHLGQMSRLEKLTLFQINADGVGLGDDAIRSLTGLESLRELTIIECGTTDAGVKLLKKLPHLTALTLSKEGSLTDGALKSIARLSRLRSLSLPSYVGTRRGRMRFSADGIRHLKGLKELESLHLVGHDVPADALMFPKLKSLALGYAGPDDPRELGRDAIGDDVAKRIHALRALRDLELSYFAVSDDGLKFVAGLPELRRLTLRSSRITDAGIDHFRYHKRLEHVTLRVAGATDKGLRHLAQVQSLTRLDLDGGGRQFSMAGLQQLKYLPRLETLWLTNFDIPGGGYDGLKELRHLRELTLLRANITEMERDALAKALPNTRISAATGRGDFYPRVPKRDR